MAMAADLVSKSVKVSKSLCCESFSRVFPRGIGFFVLGRRLETTAQIANEIREREKN
jgi:hypothetical protein